MNALRLNKLFNDVYNFFLKLFNIESVKYKILYTLFFISVYRFGSYIPIPGVNPLGVMNFTHYYGSNFLGFLNLISSFTGGAFSRASLLSLGVMPYISSSILIQLMRLVIPHLQRLKNEGEVGRKKINYIIRWCTVGVCIFQSISYVLALTNQFIPFYIFPRAYFIDLTNYYYLILFWINAIFLLTMGSLFTMWLGEKISEKGIGNGISVIIMSGILSKLPKAIMEEISDRVKSNHTYMLFIEIFSWILVVIFCIFVMQLVRHISIYYINRTRNLYTLGLNNNTKYVFHFVPFKVVSSGVMPIIFSQACLLIPLTCFSMLKNNKLKFLFLTFRNVYGLPYNTVFIMLIIVFTFFYTSITFPINQIVDDFRKNNIFIPNIKPGESTMIYLKNILDKTTVPGSIILSIIAALPSMFVFTGMNHKLAVFYGGTSLFIVISVFIDLINQMDCYLLTQYYDDIIGEKK